MDGIPALDLWDFVIEVFHTSPTQSKKTKDQERGNSSRDTTANKHTQNQTKGPTQHENFDLNNVDCVSSNAKLPRCGAMLYIFEDNEAVNLSSTVPASSSSAKNLIIQKSGDTHSCRETGKQDEKKFEA